MKHLKVKIDGYDGYTNCGEITTDGVTILEISDEVAEQLLALIKSHNGKVDEEILREEMPDLDERLNDEVISMDFDYWVVYGYENGFYGNYKENLPRKKILELYSDQVVPGYDGDFCEYIITADCIKTPMKIYDFEVDGIYYKKLSENTVEVTRPDDEYDLPSTYSGSITIPSSITVDNVTYMVVSIGYRAFFECESLWSITLPPSIEKIGEAAFEDCTDLFSIEIPNGVTSIENRTFALCEKLYDVSLPDSITTIGYNAFYFTDLATLTLNLPASLVSIGGSAFSQSGISELRCNIKSVPECANDAFDKDLDDDEKIDCELDVPASLVEKYKAVAPWNKFHIVPIDDDEWEWL